MAANMCGRLRIADYRYSDPHWGRRGLCVRPFGERLWGSRALRALRVLTKAFHYGRIQLMIDMVRGSRNGHRRIGASMNKDHRLFVVAATFFAAGFLACWMFMPPSVPSRATEPGAPLMLASTQLQPRAFSVVIQAPRPSQQAVVWRVTGTSAIRTISGSPSAYDPVQQLERMRQSHAFDLIDDRR